MVYANIDINHVLDMFTGVDWFLVNWVSVCIITSDKFLHRNICPGNLTVFQKLFLKKMFVCFRWRRKRCTKDVGIWEPLGSTIPLMILEKNCLNKWVLSWYINKTQIDLTFKKLNPSILYHTGKPSVHGSVNEPAMWKNRTGWFWACSSSSSVTSVLFQAGDSIALWTHLDNRILAELELEFSDVLGIWNRLNKETWKWIEFELWVELSILIPSTGPMLFGVVLELSSFVIANRSWA